MFAFDVLRARNQGRGENRLFLPTLAGRLYSFIILERCIICRFKVVPTLAHVNKLKELAM
jgi:hypothetical protein